MYFASPVVHIDVPLTKQKGIIVGHTPDVLTNDVADLAICLTLMVLRRVNENARFVS